MRRGVAGAELCDSDDAGRGGDDSALCGWVYRVCGGASGVVFLCDADRVWVCGVPGPGDCAAVRAGAGDGECVFAGEF